MPEPFELSAAQAASAIRDGRLTAVDLMESLLARSAALEPSLRVWVTLDEDLALSAARRADDEMRRSGPAGPLHGVPVGVKDIYYTADMKTTSGSPMHADFRPGFDSTAVALLRRGGAIVMGKTVTTEFACADPSPTRNPWNAAHTPGGSSSGSAAGVAARIFPAALGSQTAGSVVRPASYNGVVGMKPTFGLVSRHGVTPVSWSLDTMGFFCRTVEDAALLLSCLSEYDPNDGASAPVSERAPVEPLEGDPAPPRIGAMRRFFYEKAEPEARDATDEAIEKLSAAGAVVEEVAVEAGYDDLLAAHRVVMAVEAAAVHERRFAARADEYGPKVRGLIESGMLAPAVSYVQAQRVRETIPARDAGGGERVRRGAGADHALSAGGPEHDRQPGVPGSVDELRLSGDHAAVRAVRVRAAAGRPVGGWPARGGAPALGGRVVRAGHRLRGCAAAALRRLRQRAASRRHGASG